MLQAWPQTLELLADRIRRRVPVQHRAPIRVQLHAILLERTGQGSPTLCIIGLLAGNVFAELKPTLQRSYRITRLRRDGCTTRKQNSDY